MKETIILSNINEKELLRSLAINDEKFLNCRIFNANNLSKEALIRSGILPTKKEISTLKQICIIYNILPSIDYFKESSFIDAKNITDAINYARKLCRNNEFDKLNDVLSDGYFKDKNNALLEVYKKYIEYLDNNKLNDSISLINEAINKTNTINADFISFVETPLDPIEEELLKKISNNSYKTISIKEFVNKKDKVLNDLTYTNAYGSINEIEHILAYVGKNKIPYEDVLIVLIDNSYINHLLSYEKTYEIPITYGIGLALSDSNAFKVLTLLNRWNKAFNGTDSFKDLIYAQEFDTNKFFNSVNAINLTQREENELIKTIGNLRLTVNNQSIIQEYENVITESKEIKRLEIVKKIASELNNGYSYLIKTYTKIESEIDQKAINTICDSIDEYFNNVSDGILEDVIEILSNKKIARSLSCPSKIHVTDLKGALSCIRPHMFICGLNAKNFPGSPKENYLLLDTDLDRFNEPSSNKSNKKIDDNKKILLNVLNNASAFGSKIHLSYAGYNLAELKVENPSSMLFEIFKQEHNDKVVSTKDLEEAIGEQVKYFDEPISPISSIGSKYLEGITTKQEEKEIDNNMGIKYNARISPSSAEIFFSCPKRFYLKQILGIEEPEIDDPFIILPNNDLGTLIHKCMEDYGDNPNWSIKEYKNNANKIIDSYFIKRRTIYEANIKSIKNEFLDIAEYGYEINNKLIGKNTVYGLEKYVSSKDPDTNLEFGGIVDRIEKLENGKLRIIDYKTYSKVKNIEDDIDTCFQVVLYAYLLELNGEQIEDLEYRYLKLQKIIKCAYNDGMKDQLKKKLKEIKDAIDTGNFPINPNEESCKYCKFAKICGKDEKANNEAEVDGEK